MIGTKISEARYKHEEILEKIRCNDKDFKFREYSHLERLGNLKGFLKTVVDSVGCNDYLFILSLTELVGRYGGEILNELWEILDIYHNYKEKVSDSISRDVAFAAFYCLVHYYYREFDADNLKKLLLPIDKRIQELNDIEKIEKDGLDYREISYSNYKEDFADYPLIFELLSKYYVVKEDYDTQLIMASAAIKSLQKNCGKKMVNHGVNISYAGAVCSIIEENYLYNEELRNFRNDLKDMDAEAKSQKLHKISLKNADLSVAFNTMKEGSLSLVENYIDGAMKFVQDELGIDYPKYHYLKAKIKFYSVVLKNYLEGSNKYTFDEEELLGEINKAIELEKQRSSHDLEKRTYVYSCLEEYIKSYNKSQFNEAYTNYHSKIHKIRTDTDLINLKSEFVPWIDENTKYNYLFVSYSSGDYKRVYCDLVEMQKKGIRYWFDAGTHVGVDWKSDVKKRIDACSAVIFYMSVSSVTSAPVIEELNYILQSNKPIICINLCGKSVTSKALVGMIRGEGDKVVGSINSNTLKTVCTACPDYVVTLQRARDMLNVSHIDKLYNDLFKTCPSVISYVESRSKRRVGNDKQYKDKADKFKVRPNEDYLVEDKTNHIYVVADGISRSQDEYREFLKGNVKGEKTIAGRVSKVFCKSLQKHVKEMLKDVRDEKLLEQDFALAFDASNGEVGEFLQSHRDEYFYTPENVKPYYEKPGCVAIAAFIHGSKLYYGSVGDCMGILFRKGRRIIFSDKQTDYAFKMLDKEKDRPLLYSKFVNKPENPFGYGVINGDKDAVRFFAASHFDVESGDEIYLVSDGISDYIQYGNIEDILNAKLKDLISKEDERREDQLKELTNELGEEQAKKLVKKQDDKAIIRIKIK